MTARLSILLVFDDVRPLRLLEATLKLRSYEVLKAASLEEALAGLHSGVLRPDVVLPDFRRSSDALELVREVRGSPDLLDVALVLPIAPGDPADVFREMGLAPDEFLHKPFSVEDLLQQVERVLDRRRAEDHGFTTLSSGRSAHQGDLVITPFEHLVDELADERATGTLRIDPEGAATVATLHLRGGRVIEARFGSLTAEAALVQLLTHSVGPYRFEVSDVSSVSPSLSDDTRELLLRGRDYIERGLVQRVDPCDMVAAGRATLALQAAEQGDLGEEDPSSSLFGLITDELDQDIEDFSETLSAMESLEFDLDGDPTTGSIAAAGEGLSAPGLDDFDQDSLLLALGSLTDAFEPVQEDLGASLSSSSAASGGESSDPAGGTPSADPPPSAPAEVGPPAPWPGPSVAPESDGGPPPLSEGPTPPPGFPGLDAAASSGSLVIDGDRQTPVAAAGAQRELLGSKPGSAAAPPLPPGYPAALQGGWSETVSDDVWEGVPTEVDDERFPGAESWAEFAPDPTLSAVAAAVPASPRPLPDMTFSEEVGAATSRSPAPSSEYVALDLELPTQGDLAGPEHDPLLVRSGQLPQEVTLVDDGSFAPLPGGGVLDLMELFNGLREVADEALGASGLQLSTREATIIASTLKDVLRSRQVAAFSSNSVSYASLDRSGIPFATLNVVELNVVVLQVDSRRLVTILFDDKPDVLDVLDALRDLVVRHRGRLRGRA